MATHSSILAWKIPWTEEPDRLQSIGSQRDTIEATWHVCSVGEYLPVGGEGAGIDVAEMSKCGDSLLQVV